MSEDTYPIHLGEAHQLAVHQTFTEETILSSDTAREDGMDFAENNVNSAYARRRSSQGANDYLSESSNGRVERNFMESSEELTRTTRPSFCDEEVNGTLQIPKKRVRKGGRSRANLLPGSTDSLEVSGDDISKSDLDEYEGDIKESGEVRKERRKRKGKKSTNKGNDAQSSESSIPPSFSSSSSSSSTSTSSYSTLSTSTDAPLEMFTRGNSQSTLSPNSVFHITRGGNASSANLVSDLAASQDGTSVGVGVVRSPSMRQSSERLLPQIGAVKTENENEQVFLFIFI